jgi:hypothetical protein
MAQAKRGAVARMVVNEAKQVRHGHWVRGPSSRLRPSTPRRPVCGFCSTSNVRFFCCSWASWACKQRGALSTNPQASRAGERIWAACETTCWGSRLGSKQTRQRGPSKMPRLGLAHRDLLWRINTTLNHKTLRRKIPPIPSTAKCSKWARCPPYKSIRAGPALKSDAAANPPGRKRDRDRTLALSRTCIHARSN